ncbi:hypothetical protein ACWEFL_15500 [Streptomyces sp. NPDC004838]
MLSRVGKTMMGTGVALVLGTMVTGVVLLPKGGDEDEGRGLTGTMDFDVGGGPILNRADGEPQDGATMSPVQDVESNAPAGDQAWRPAAGSPSQPGTGVRTRSGTGTGTAAGSPAKKAAKPKADRVTPPAAPRNRSERARQGDGCRDGATHCGGRGGWQGSDRDDRGDLDNWNNWRGRDDGDDDEVDDD